MNIERTSIWGGAALALRNVGWRLNVKRRKMNMVEEGRRLGISIGLYTGVDFRRNNRRIHLRFSGIPCIQH